MRLLACGRRCADNKRTNRQARVNSCAARAGRSSQEQSRVDRVGMMAATLPPGRVERRIRPGEFTRSRKDIAPVPTKLVQLFSRMPGVDTLARLAGMFRGGRDHRRKV